MITYFVEFAILHLLFFGIYKLMLAKETQLEFLRFFLIGSTLLSLILPAIKIPTQANIPTIDMEPILLPMVTTATVEEAVQLPWYQLFIGFISVLLALRMLLTLMKIYGWYQQSELDTHHQISIRKVVGLQNSFTFIQWIFIDPKNFENPQDIIRHEQGHARKLHSLDLLFFHVVSILFWWVPSVWLMIRELKSIHEFQADAYALKIDDKTYTKTLVQCTLKAHGMDLASSFDDAPIFNRLNFIKKMKKKINVWKVASIATIVAISGVMFACEEQLEAEITEIIEESNQQTEYSDEVKASLDELQKQFPDKEFAVVETTLDNEASIRKINEYDPQQIAKIFVSKENGVGSVVMIVRQDSELFNKSIHIQEQDDVFTIVEKAASFPGGVQEFGTYLSENLKYPNQAKELGVEGVVYVQFIVEENGSITNVEVVRGIGAGCDAEALRVIEDSPDWEPGTQGGKAVRQKMVQKISFKLPA